MPQYIEKSEDGKYEVKNPSHPRENFAEKWNEHPERAGAFYEWIKQAKIDLIENLKDADSRVQAGNLLKQSLGESLVQKSFAEVDAALGKAMLLEVLETEEILRPSRIKQLLTVPHRQKLPWILPKGNGVLISATVTDNNGKSSIYVSDGTQIEKNASIVFKALFAGYKQPFTVRWQIVNTGYEANAAKQLRGGLEVSNAGERGRTESAKYSGSHYVQCFVTRKNQCLAKSDIFIVNIV